MSYKQALASTQMKYAIFSLNNHSNPFDIAEMHAVLNSLGYQPPSPCLGLYNGVTERSWLTTSEALGALLDTPEGRALLDKQESFLLLSECNKQYAELFYPEWTDGFAGASTRESIGSLKRITQEEAQKADAWTYHCATKQWFTTVKENPDNGAPADAVAREFWRNVDEFLRDVDDLGACGPHVPTFIERLQAYRAAHKPKWIH